MPAPLKNIIIEQIKSTGPMSVGDFMALALGHPKHGYYMKQDPFGRAGDFITAPEVSQLFGEMIGAWVADIWLQMGAQERFILLECGPGRGTLMADIMRATRGVEGFHAAAEVHLLEISPVLKAIQREILAGYDVCWCKDLSGVPGDAPLVVIGNEFLDALGFQQFVGAHERKVDIDGEGLVFTHAGAIVEHAPEREAFAANVAARLKTQSGAALFIDYGYVQPGAGDTFQAIKGHEYVDVFSHIGDADLTSHVDFSALKAGLDCVVGGPVEQGVFLKALGVEVRAAMLAQSADAVQRAAIEKGLHRLTHSDQMGKLFKVISFWDGHDKNITPAGF